jgi:hypothetical protein
MKHKKVKLPKRGSRTKTNKNKSILKKSKK